MYPGRGQKKVSRSQKLIERRMILVVEDISFGFDRITMMMTLEIRAMRARIGRRYP